MAVSTRNVQPDAADSLQYIKQYGRIEYLNNVNDLNEANSDDDGTSTSIRRANPSSSTISNNSLNGTEADYFRSISHSAGLFQRKEIDLFNNRYRFGILNPYEALSTCKEYLFFTKPDLNIYPRVSGVQGATSAGLHEYLATQPFWIELNDKHFDVIKLLQQSLDTTTKFNNLLANTVQSNLDVPSMSSDMIETPNNPYGVGYTYRGSSESSDDSFDFSLEFRDTKYLPVYNFFRAYEDYQTIKHHGKIKPWDRYIINKILYDQYSIYKFMVDQDDGETIIYYGKYYGVKSKTLPRDVFSNANFDNGLSYSIDFNAAFYDDKPFILREFNALNGPLYDSLPYDISIHNDVLDRVDNRPAKAAKIVAEYSPNAGDYVYKLKWRGDEKY